VIGNYVLTMSIIVHNLIKKYTQYMPEAWTMARMFKSEVRNKSIKKFKMVKK